MILLIGQIGKWSKLGDITLDVIEERLGGEAEGRYEQSLGCFVLYNQQENGHMYEENINIDEIEGSVVLAKGCNGGCLDELTESKVIEYINKVVEQYVEECN